MLLACALVLAPAIAAADDGGEDCVRPYRLIGPLKITKADIRVPRTAVGKPSRYKLNATWTNVRATVSQFVQIRGGKRFYGSSFSGQRAISVDAYSPEDRGWLWVDDDNVSTPGCQMLGRRAWQAPRVFVRETAKVIYIAAAAQPAIGDHSGCALSPRAGIVDCPVFTRAIIKLKRTVGTRKIVLEHWGPPSEEDEIITPTATVLS